MNSWNTGGPTRICRGINSATTNLTESSTGGAFQSMVVMSDGIANRQCTTEQNTGSATGDAVQAACDAWEDYNITVHAVAFGDGADELTMQQIALCGNGTFYSSDVGGLVDLYQNISEDIIGATYVEQTVIATGNISTTLHPDSYIEFNYVQPPIPFGLIVTLENQFNNATSGNFSVPAESTIVETRVSSYSGPRWTDNVKINTTSVYKLSDYGSDYIVLGDPYSINIPNQFVSSDNVIALTTGLAPEDSSNGSIFNKIIYTINKSVSAFSAIKASANGCIWNIQFEDDSNITGLLIPEFYNGTDNCYYGEDLYFDGEIGDPIPGPIVANENDAFQVAVFILLEQLDFNANDKIDFLFTGQDLQIDLTELIGIPFTWSTEVQVRVWD